MKKTVRNSVFLLSAGLPLVTTISCSFFGPIKPKADNQAIDKDDYQSNFIDVAVPTQEEFDIEKAKIKDFESIKTTSWAKENLLIDDYLNFEELGFYPFQWNISPQFRVKLKVANMDNLASQSYLNATAEISNIITTSTSLTYYDLERFTKTETVDLKIFFTSDAPPTLALDVTTPLGKDGSKAILLDDHHGQIQLPSHDQSISTKQIENLISVPNFLEEEKIAITYSWVGAPFNIDFVHTFKLRANVYDQNGNSDFFELKVLVFNSKIKDEIDPTLHFARYAKVGGNMITFTPESSEYDGIIKIDNDSVVYKQDFEKLFFASDNNLDGLQVVTSFSYWIGKRWDRDRLDTKLMWDSGYRKRPVLHVYAKDKAKNKSKTYDFQIYIKGEPENEYPKIRFLDENVQNIYRNPSQGMTIAQLDLGPFSKKYNVESFIDPQAYDTSDLPVDPSGSFYGPVDLEPNFTWLTEPFNPDQAGIYSLKVSTTDEAENTSNYYLNINVQDDLKPHITFKYADFDLDKTPLAGATFIKGAGQALDKLVILQNSPISQSAIENALIANDAKEGILDVKQLQFNWLAKFDTSKVDSTILEAKITDSEGNEGVYQLAIEIVDQTSPEITIKPNQTIKGAEVIFDSENPHEGSITFRKTTTPIPKEQFLDLFNFYDASGDDLDLQVKRSSEGGVMYDSTKPGSYLLIIVALDRYKNQSDFILNVVITN